MITYSVIEEKQIGDNKYIYLEGDALSTDTLPTTYAGKPIYNGSSMFFMNTCKVAFFNQTANAWQIKGTNV